MKLKGIWVAIAVICVAGIGITDYSARHLAGSEAQYVSGEAAQQAVSGQADMAPVETEAAAEAARAFSVQNTAAEPGEEPLSENARIMAQADLPEEAEDGKWMGAHVCLASLPLPTSLAAPDRAGLLVNAAGAS